MRPPFEFPRSPAPQPLTPERVAAVAKGLAHPVRAAIAMELADGSELSSGEIVGMFGLAQSTVSEHLRVLREAGVVTTRRDGPRVFYRLEGRVLRSMAAVLARLSEDPTP